MSALVTESRKARRSRRDAVGVAAGALAAARRALAEAKAQHLDNALAELSRREEHALSALADAKREEAAALARVEEHLAEFREAPVDRIATLNPNIPVAFYPVRIETRFRRGRAGAPVGIAPPASELLVRIYPDSVLADEHEPLLTADEVAAGRDYWHRAWREGDERDAWTLLLKRTMAPRAAWIVSQTSPVNAAERPASGEQSAPQFADIATRPDGWHRAPEARGLPERWIVSAYRDRKRVHQLLSAPVREGLALTIRLTGEGAPGEEAELIDLTGDGLTVEPSVLWAYDFEAALAAGMAVRIPLTNDDLRLGFSHVVVVGVRTSETPEVQAEEIAALISAQNARRGVALAPQGAKTNNTTENSSDYPPADGAGSQSFATYRGSPLATPGHDGQRLMGALGLARETADHIWGADRDEQTGALAMLDALWPATLGYFMRQMMAPNVTPGMAEQLRQWARANLRGRGPYPAFRVGPAPYGLLPVGPLSAWRGPVEGFRQELPQALQRLAPLWLAASQGAPRVGRSADLEADLVGALAMDASMQTAQIRRATGYEATWNIWGFHGLNLQTFEELRSSIGRELLQTLGVPSWDPRVLRLNFAERAYDFSGPLIEDRPLSETERLAFNYIAWLRTASITDLQKQGAPPADPPVNALLYLMLRHALLSEYDASAQQVLQSKGMLAAEELREAELIAVVPSAQGQPVQRTAWDRFGVKIAGVTGDRTLGELIADPGAVSPAAPAPLQQAFGDVAAYRGALERLENLPTAELHRLFGETLDLTSHRLDAWLVGLFDERLREMRANNPEGLYIGCYGWVEDLRADPPSPRVPITRPDGAPAEARTDSDGYVFAPSMLQGAVAAVLRSAYLSRSGPARDAYAIDLSSRRVRTALWLIDTVRAEQPLGAALGYRFERGLHEGHPGVELDQFIDELRELYPLTANKAEDSGQPAESVAARNVVDGLRLNKAWRENEIPFGVDGRLAMNTAQRTAVDAELLALDDAVDAVSDLMTAEAVYQVLKGSAAGAAAALDTLAKGTRPPDIEVATTPRGGKALHQRYVIALGAGNLPTEWASIPSSPRAAAAPELNAWLARKFGQPGAIACVVTREGAPAREVTVADLGLQAIDLFLLTRTAETEGGASDIDRRIAWHVAGPVGPDVSIVIDYDAAISSDAVTFAQAFEIASAIGRALGFARPLKPADLLPPEQETRAAEADLLAGELRDRADAAFAELEGAISDLTNALASPDPGALRAALLRGARLGLPGAFPPNRHDPEAGGALSAPAEAALSALASRRDAVRDAAGDAERLQAIFGRDFTVVARFRAAAVELLGPALAAEPGLGAEPDATVERWVAGLARVREPVAAWRRLTLYERALGRGLGRPRIVQLPLESDPAIPRWAALSFDGAPPRAGLVSLAIEGAPPQAGDAWSALLLDAWPELAPNDEEDAGVAFHYDAPGSQAPQAVLLAVTPPGRQAWSFELLEQTLFQALDLARMRTVDLETLGPLGQILPMSFLTANPKNATVSTSFAGLTVADATITLQS